MPEPTSRPEIELPDGRPPMGPVLEAVFGEAESRFALRADVGVYRIVEEPLTHVVRHGAARSSTMSPARPPEVR